jgi:hypothetical protein
MHPQVMVVGLDPAHRAHDLGIDIAQETRDFAWLLRREDLRRGHIAVARVVPDIGADHDDDDAHQEHDENIGAQRAHEIAVMVQRDGVEYRRRGAEDGRHEAAADQVRLKRPLGVEARHDTTNALAENNRRADDAAPVEHPKGEGHRFECREGTDDRRDQTQRDPGQNRERRRPRIGRQSSALHSSHY